MKLISTLVAASIVALATLPAQAATATANFNVTANLTSVCSVTAAPTDLIFTYTSFQAAAATGAGGAFSVKCTTSLPFSMSINTVASNTVIGLTYTLGLATGAAPGTPITTSTGTGAAASYVVTGSMAAGQSGICATAGGACSGTNIHQLTVTY